MTQTIRDLFKASGKTLVQLGEISGLSPEFLSRVQNAKRNLSAGSRKQLADALKISTATLAAAEDETLNIKVPLDFSPDPDRTNSIDLGQSEARGAMIDAMKKRLVMEILDLPAEFVPAADKMLEAIRLMVASSRPQKGKQTS